MNRHTIVLFLGLAALVLLRGGDVAVHASPLTAFSLVGVAFLCSVIGLFLDSGIPQPKTDAAHGLQGLGAVLLIADGVKLVTESRLILASAELGIALALLGVLVEMRAAYRGLRLGVVLQIFGDVFYLSGLGWALAERQQQPSTLGWIFIGIAGLLGAYAAVSNLILQIGRARDPQAGWRYRITAWEPAGIQVKTPQGLVHLQWNDVQSVHALDGRHLILVLPSPLPDGLKAAGLPLEELRENEEERLNDSTPPEKYGLVFHEQELGHPVLEAQRRVRAQLPARA